MAPALPMRISTNKSNGNEKDAMTYESLDVDNIRIIRLKSLDYNRAHDIPEDIITCELESVDRSQVPRYSAISYAWGSGEYDQEIRIGGSPYFISFNLGEAFRHVRHEKDEILLWADQLCINQNDDNEKSQQVQMMKMIYENALTVIIWLGGSADNSDLVMTTLQELARYNPASEIQGALAIPFIAQRISDLSGTAWSEQHVLSALQDAFEKFCNRSYWKRLWVIQEFAVCSELLIKCGRFDLQGEEFLNAWVNVETLASKHRFHVDRLGATLSSKTKSFVSGLVTGRRTYRENPMPLYNVMFTNLILEEDYNHPQCSDPRDRVFSLLGLASDFDNYGQFPDYTKTTEEIFEELARAMLKQGIFNVLALNQFPRNFPAMPSWAPDWSMPIRIPIGGNTNFHRPPRASTYATQTKILFLDRHTIVMVGTFVDTVEETGAEWNPNWLEPLKPLEAMPYLRDVERFCNMSPRIPQEKVKLTSARIAVADSGGKPSAFWNNIVEHYDAAFACFARGEVLPQYSDDSSDPQLVGELIKASKYAIELKRLHSRRVIITQSGYVGLAPSHVTKGDRICLFLGADSPYTIRDGSNDSFTLVGDCYIYGIMQGGFLRKHHVLEPIKLV